MIRPHMQLGWFMAYALGAMHIRDNGHVVVKAWCADTEDGDKPDANVLGTYTKLDHKRGIMHVSATPFSERERGLHELSTQELPVMASRAGGKTQRLRELVSKLKESDQNPRAMNSEEEIAYRLAKEDDGLVDIPGAKLRVIPEWAEAMGYAQKESES